MKTNDEAQSNWQNTPKRVKQIIYLVAAIIIILFCLFIKGYLNAQHDEDYLFNKWNAKDSVKMKVIENKLGQLSYIAEATKLNGEQIKKYAESDEKLSLLTKKYSSLLAIVTQKMGVYVDTIKTEFHDTLPCSDFVKKDSIKNRYYNFHYMITKKEFMISNLEFPDTCHTIIGERKSGFLNLKRSLVVEQTHSNKYMKVQQINPVVKVQKNKWPAWLGTGVGLGLLGGFFLFK